MSCMLVLLTPGTVLLVRAGARAMGTPLDRRPSSCSICVLSSPGGAGLLARTLTGQVPAAYLGRPRPAARRVVVVLGAGSVNLRAAGRQLSSVTVEAGLRVLEAARLFDLLNGPLVIASGGVTERDGGGGAGVGGAAARADRSSACAPSGFCSSRSRRTPATKRSSSSGCWPNAALTDFVLVTSPLHMRRSMLAFEQQGMHPIPSPAPLVPERPTRASRLLSERYVASDRRLRSLRMAGARLLLVARLAALIAPRYSRTSRGSPTCTPTMRMSALPAM